MNEGGKTRFVLNAIKQNQPRRKEGTDAIEQEKAYKDVL